MIATVQAERASSKGFYRPELDALRCFAFLAVYVCHSIPAAWANTRTVASIRDAGNFGVCLFFLLSAYLITDLLRREYEQFGTIQVRAFYFRRALRIWPLYFGITIAYAIGGLFFHALRMEPGRIAAYFLLAGNWYIALHPWIQTPLRALWSISVEEQFYLVWPLLGKFGAMRALAVASVALVPLSVMTIFIVSGSAYAYNTVWLNSFAQFLFFALGALLSLVLRGNFPRPNIAMRLLLVLSGLLAWWMAAAVTLIKRPYAHVSAMQFCFGYLLVASGSALLFLSALGVSKQFVPRWIAYLGKISFGLYVFHEMAFLFVDEAQRHAASLLPANHIAQIWLLNKIVALGLTILLAGISYRFYEYPFLRLKQHYSRVASRSV